jgi:hypothetical protein
LGEGRFGQDVGRNGVSDSGIEKYGEAGVAMTFEETGEGLTSNLASPGHNLKALQRRKRLTLDYVHVERRQIKKPASTISKASLSGSITPFDRSTRNALSSTPSKFYSPACAMRLSFAPN